MAQIARLAHPLRVLNLNYTSATPGQLLDVIIHHKDLEVQKLAGLQNWASTRNFLKIQKCLLISSPPGFNKLINMTVSMPPDGRQGDFSTC